MRRMTPMHVLLGIMGLSIVLLSWYGLASQTSRGHANTTNPTRRLSTVERQAASEGLGALQALHSVTSGGIPYRDYAPRVFDAKVTVDRYLAIHREDDETIAASFSRSLALHVFASRVWNASIGAAADSYVGPNFMHANRDEAATLCPLVIPVWEKAHEGDQNIGGTPTFSSEHYRAALDESIATLWRCSAESVAAAARRLSERS